MTPTVALIARFLKALGIDRAFGIRAERVTRAANLPAAIDRALARRPARLDVVVTTEALSSDARSGLAWVPDLQPLAAWDARESAFRHQGSAAPASSPAAR
jgi:acetolactate synthase I/II/III large subunit